MPRLVLPLTISASLIGALLAICLRLPSVHRATVALVLVLAIVGLAKMWGWRESLIAAVVSGIGFDYYFLPPRGLGIDTFEGWTDLIAFLITAVVTGQMVARSKRLRFEAEERKTEAEKLHKLANAVSGIGIADFSLAQLAAEIVEIFGAGGVALYDRETREIVRAGPYAGSVSDQELQEAATHRRQLAVAARAFSVVPIEYAGESVGSIGVSGVSPSLVSAIGAQVGAGLARVHSIERTTEAEAARRSDELKSAALDAMAHEIRNPLNSIKIAATTLLSKHAGSEMSKRELLTIIDEEATRMDRLLDDGVRMARLEPSTLSVKKKPQNLARLIPAAIEEMGESARRRPIQVSIPEGLPPAECDQCMIARVLKQLLSNALKYSPDGSPLAVSAEFTGSAVVISVVDRGPGVDEDERDSIFEKHYRGRVARSSTSGTGLGLASARTIVNAHGGEIWMTSPTAGGSAFHVLLPVMNGQPPAGGELNWALRKS